MSKDPSATVGLAIVRCWSEGDDGSGFRAHVTILDDLDEPPTVTTYTATIEQVVDEVVLLLSRFAAHDA